MVPFLVKDWPGLTVLHTLVYAGRIFVKSTQHLKLQLDFTPLKLEIAAAHRYWLKPL